MPTHEQYILHILGESSEPLHSSVIAKRLNRTLGSEGAYSPTDVVKRLQGMRQKVDRLADGRWRLKRSRREVRSA